MKKFKFLILAVTVALLSFACEDDGGSSVITLEDGVVPNMVKDVTTDSFLDFIKVESGEDISVSFSTDIAQGQATSTDIIAVYKAATGGVYNSVLFNDVTLPKNFTISISDIVSSFSELNSSDDIKLGDVLSITTSFIRADGTVLSLLNDDGTDNFSSNIKGSALFNTVINYPVSCPTMLEGNYTSTVISSNIPNTPDNFISPQQVIITQPSAGTYNLSDGTAGIFGAATPIILEFTDVCEIITVTESSISFPGQVDFAQGNATNLNSDTGVITLDLTYTATSCCGLAGIQYTIELTPN